MTQIINDAFNDVDEQSLPVKEGVAGASNLTDILSMQVGVGDEVFRSDESGIWLGASKFADAPFSVDMDGTLKATSGSITGYVLVGGAAGDVNGGVTTISGGKITANSISADRLNVATLSAISANMGTITAGNITADVITTGTLNVDRVPNMSANKITSDSFSTDRIPNLNASKITAGTITVGGSDQPTALIIQHSTNDSNSRMRFEGGSRIWEDSSNNVGINALGSELDLYVNSNQVAYFGSGNTNIYQHLHVPNIDLALGGSEGSIYNIDQLVGTNDLRITANGDCYFYRDGSGGAGVRFAWGSGKIYSYSSSINLGGTDKTAIVPTKDGYKALYSMESPGVWFMDFCYGKKKRHFPKFWEYEWLIKPDLTFLEVIEGQIVVIPTGVKNIVQIWAKRKGHAEKRFEAKTKAEYEKNEAFLKQAKI